MNSCTMRETAFIQTFGTETGRSQVLVFAEFIIMFAR